MIRDWWDGLSVREQYLVGAGSIVAVVLLVYALIWTPLSNTVANKRQAVAKKYTLLDYLAHAANTVTRLRDAGVQVSSVAASSQDLTTAAENTFSTQGLSAFIKQVQQPSNNSVSFLFSAAPFDKLMHALHLLAQEGVRVSSFTALRTTESGVVNAQVTLSR